MTCVLVCGGRNFLDVKMLDSVLDRLNLQYGFTLVIEGGAKGADSLANNPRLRRQRQVAQTIREGLMELHSLSRVHKSEEFFALLFRLLQEQIGERLDASASSITESVVDEKLGLFVNHDLAEYHVPVHADIPAIEAVFLDEVDDKTNPLKIKGLGELGICGAGAALANAVYNACGVRLRDYPLTLDKLLSGPGL